MGYQTVRALIPVRHNGVLRIPGQTAGDNAQDFVAEDSQVAKLVALGVVSSLGVASAPPVQSGQGLSNHLGIFDDIDALSKVYPASSNKGNTAVAGSASVVSNGFAWIPASALPLPDQDIPVAYYGDSKTAIVSHTTFDLRSTVPAAGSAVSAITNPMTLSCYYPRARPVANCGIGGETLVQMLSREMAAASATRKNLTDAATCGARVLIFRPGINDVGALSTPTANVATDPLVAAIHANRCELLLRAMQRGFIVLDEGYMGNSKSLAADVLAYRRAAVVYLDAQAKAFAAQYPGSIYFLSAQAVVGDGNGGIQTQYCDSLGLHLNLRGAIALGKAEAAFLTSIFGPVPNSYNVYRGPNLITWSDMGTDSQVASAGGFKGSTAIGALFSNASVVTATMLQYQGKRYSTFTFTTTASGGAGGMQVDARPFIGSTAGTAVAANTPVGVELDVYVDDGAGGPPPDINDAALAFNVTLRLSDGTNLYTWSHGNAAYGNNAPSDGPLCMRVALPVISMPQASTAINNSLSQLLVSYACAASGKTMRIGMANPRIVVNPVYA